MSAVDQIRQLVGSVPDPELPVLTIDELGILREVKESDGEGVIVTLTPTYSGCPAMDPICRQVERRIAAFGFNDVEVRLQLKPAWTTDWITPDGRRKLRDYGIAPPPEQHEPGCPLARVDVACPRCGSCETKLVSRFGATPCQAHYVCQSCLEPFSHFKAH